MKIERFFFKLLFKSKILYICRTKFKSMSQTIMEVIKLNPDPFRSSQQTILHGFDRDFEPFQYEIYGYAQGDKIDRLKNLSIFHFDSLEFITKSTNAKKGGDFIHAKGHRKKEGSFKVIILKRKKCIKIQNHTDM